MMKPCIVHCQFPRNPLSELMKSRDIEMITKGKKKTIMEPQEVSANHRATPTLISRDWEANAMASGWKKNKQHATNHANPNRQRRQNLLSRIGRRWVKAVHHILIKQSNGAKNQNRHESVQEINKSHPILSRRHVRKVHRAVDDPEPSESGEPITNIPLTVSETIGKTHKKTGQSTETHEGRGEVARNRVAVAFIGENGGK